MLGSDLYVNQNNYVDGDDKPAGAFIGQRLLATNGSEWQWTGTQWIQTKSSGQVSVKNGAGDLALDAWGTPKASIARSLFHGMFTFDISPSMWLIETDGAEVAELTANGATSVDSALVIDTSGASVVADVLVKSRRHPRYQPNRGHLFSTAVILPDSTNDGTRDFGLFTDENGAFFRLKSDGELYAVLRTGNSGTPLETEELITIPANFIGFDVEKGNIYDIQFQWRGVGNYKFFIGNPATGVSELVHTMSKLSTLTALSMENPALPAAYKGTKGTGDVIIKVGCGDITSESGITDREQYASISNAHALASNNEEPVLSIHAPDLINGETNTRDLRLARISGTSDGNFRILWKIYITRDPAALTGEVFAAIGNGDFTELDTTATAVVPANAKEVLSFKTPANESEFIENPSKETIDFYVTHGDYLIVTATGSNGNTVIGTIEYGIEI